MMNKMLFHFIINLAALGLLFGGCADPGCADSFKIAGYNVENLFDLHADATEYPEYHPGGKFGWDSKMLGVKLKNIASVINDLDAEIVALQEIESEEALSLLQKQLSMLDKAYRYSAIARKRLTSVKCAVLSRFPILDEKEIIVGHGDERSILKVVLEIAGNPLVVYVNHWKSKSGPESKRIKYATALAADISKLACNVDFVLIGDFNSNYNEYKTVKDSPRLNDSRGVTGINHTIGTVRNKQMVTEFVLTSQKDCGYLYNLWLEIPESRRWSVNFFGRKNSPDNIIVSRGLYDKKGISYVDNSFDKFDPDYLFENGKVFRWQRSAGGSGRHLGRGYSDHLPIFAQFSTDPFYEASGQKTDVSEPEIRNIADLYGKNNGSANIRINKGVVIYKENGNAVIKQKNGRAIYIYKAAKELEYAMTYDLTVTRLNRHYGNLEITGIKDIKPLGRATDIADCFVAEENPDFSEPGFCNEIIDRVRGIYENGWFHYGKDRKIKIYFSDPALKPEGFSIITLSRVRVGFHRHPEIIVEKPEQLSGGGTGK